jgi:hypothetical protein
MSNPSAFIYMPAYLYSIVVLAVTLVAVAVLLYVNDRNIPRQ